MVTRISFRLSIRQSTSWQSIFLWRCFVYANVLWQFYNYHIPIFLPNRRRRRRRVVLWNFLVSTCAPSACVSCGSGEPRNGCNSFGLRCVEDSFSGTIDSSSRTVHSDGSRFWVRPLHSRESSIDYCSCQLPHWPLRISM